MVPTRRVVIAAAFLACAANASAQGGLPTSQPNYLVIVREEVKLGRGSEHQRSRTSAGSVPSPVSAAATTATVAYSARL